jgi:hypothetical protein
MADKRPFRPPLQIAYLVCLLLYLPNGSWHCSAEALGTNDSLTVLFNGTNLAGFYSWLVDTRYEDPRRVFSITNGTIRISGDGLGYLATTNEFENYHFLAEFKWGQRNSPWGDRIGRARDSGIFLHSIGPDGNSHDGKGAFRAAIECQIFEGAIGDLLLIRGNDANGRLIAPRISAAVASQRDGDGWPFWKQGGTTTNLVRWGRLNWFDKDQDWKDVTGFRGARDVEKPGEWNRLECICDGDKISIQLNAVLVNQAFGVYPRRGKILLQCEGSEIYFRKMEVRRIGNR